MIIQHNIPALNSYNKLTFNNNNLAKNLEKLSSGFRINRAADDASGLAISEKMRAQITGLDAAVQNCNDGINLIQTAEGAMNEMHTMLNRMVDIVTRASNGIYTEDQLFDFQDELDELVTEIDRIAKTTKFNDRTLLDGSLATTLQIGGSSAAADTLNIGWANAFTALYTGASTPEHLEEVDVTKGLSGVGLGLMKGTANTVKLIGYDNNNDVEITADPNKYIDDLNQVIDVLSSVRSKFGAWQNRLEHTVNNLTNVSENLSEAESRIRDVDMAKEMMAYTKNSILSQSAQAMLSQAMQQPQNVLNLLY